MISFTIFGIPVVIQPWFWISLIIIGAMGNNIDSSYGILLLGLFVLAGFISVLVHELGHALTAKSFGARSEITLQAFGGYAAYSGVRMTRTRSFLITAAGPAIQIALGFVVLGASYALPELSAPMEVFLNKLIYISFFWAILNLLPILPLDGGQMLNAIIGPKRIKVTLWITIISAIVLGLLMFIYWKRFLFPIFLGMFAWQAFQQLKETPNR